MLILTFTYAPFQNYPLLFPATLTRVPSEAPTPMDVDMPSPGALKKRVHSQRKVRKKTEAKFIAQVKLM